MPCRAAGVCLELCPIREHHHLCHSWSSGPPWAEDDQVKTVGWSSERRLEMGIVVGIVIVLSVVGTIGISCLFLLNEYSKFHALENYYESAVESTGSSIAKTQKSLDIEYISMVVMTAIVLICATQYLSKIHHTANHAKQVCHADCMKTVEVAKMQCKALNEELCNVQRELRNSKIAESTALNKLEKEKSKSKSLEAQIKSLNQEKSDVHRTCKSKDELEADLQTIKNFYYMSVGTAEYANRKRLALNVAKKYGISYSTVRAIEDAEIIIKYELLFA